MTFITQQQKELTDRRAHLALQVEIPDMAAYALEWNKLGAEFEQIGWKANAEICYSNAERYGRMEPGQYERLLSESSPIVGLAKTGEVERIPQWSDPDERVLPCGNCDTWTKHVRLTSYDGEQIGWMCGCGTYTEVKTKEQVTE